MAKIPTKNTEKKKKTTKKESKITKKRSRLELFQDFACVLVGLEIGSGEGEMQSKEGEWGGVVEDKF